MHILSGLVLLVGIAGIIAGAIFLSKSDKAGNKALETTIDVDKNIKEESYYQGIGLGTLIPGIVLIPVAIILRANGL